MLNVNRKASASVLSSATEAKEIIAKELSKEEYSGLGYFYTNDL